MKGVRDYRWQDETRPVTNRIAGVTTGLHNQYQRREAGICHCDNRLGVSGIAHRNCFILKGEQSGAEHGFNDLRRLYEKVMSLELE